MRVVFLLPFVVLTATWIIWRIMPVEDKVVFKRFVAKHWWVPLVVAVVLYVLVNVLSMFSIKTF